MSFMEDLSEEAGAVTRYTLRFAGVVFCIGLALAIGLGVFGGTSGPVIFVCGAVLALIMALFGIGLALFRVVQIRLPELMLVVAVLGSAMGMIYRSLDVTVAGSVGGKAALGLIVALPCLVWTLGGATWGLWIAKELLIDASIHRLWLVVVGLLTPPAFACAVAAIPVGAVFFSALNGAVSGLCVALFILSFVILLYALRMHLRVLKEIEDSGGREDE